MHNKQQNKHTQFDIMVTGSAMNFEETNFDSLIWPYSGGGPTEMSGRWLIPAAGYYGVPTGKNAVAKMASLRLRIGAQITRKYDHNLLFDIYT